jgi:HlyD family secretion protein
VVVAIVAVVLVARFASHRRSDAPEIPVEPVGRRDIAQTVEATGTVQPVEVTEIRSKASGQIVKMPVQVGSVVKAGDVLAQIDRLTVQNQYDEASAALKAAEANVMVTKAQKDRADQLFSQSVMTADQHESAVLAFANAQSQVVNARSNLSNAKQALGDATVRAPYDGTIIEQDVTKGQVIASAIQSASGGTLLLKMADLNRVQMQALVGETDIGNVRPDMPATVTVDAFPNRPFRGLVMKIEPQAVIQQSVTMFPVLISIANENGLLLPGMNGEVTISIAQVTNALAVPLDAVRSVRELPAVAAALGLDADSLKAQVQRQVAARMAARGRGPGGFGADSSRGRGPGRWGRQGGGWGQRGGAGQQGTGRGAWMARGGGSGFPGARGDRQAAPGDTARSGAPWAPTGGPGGGGRSGQAQVVFVQTAHGLDPRVVRLGVSDFDYAQILSGLNEGDQVAMLSVAEIQAKRQQDQARLRQRMGSGLPGAPTGGGGGGSRGGGGGGGARGGR